MTQISENTFLTALERAIKRLTDLIAVATEFHGGAVTTEYLINAEIAREFIKRGCDVRVECLNRTLVNAVIKTNGVKPKDDLGAKRTDVAIFTAGFVPLAMVEMKIGVRKLTRVVKDLDKIVWTIKMMRAMYATKMLAASVFQVYVAPTTRRLEVKHFRAEVKKIETRLDADLKVYSQAHSEFTFKLCPLQAENKGIVSPELEVDGDGNTQIIGRPGHAVRYYAILMRCTRTIPSKSSIAQLR